MELFRKLLNFSSYTCFSQSSKISTVISHFTPKQQQLALSQEKPSQRRRRAASRRQLWVPVILVTITFSKAFPLGVFAMSIVPANPVLSSGHSHLQRFFSSIPQQGALNPIAVDISPVMAFKAGYLANGSKNPHSICAFLRMRNVYSNSKPPPLNFASRPHNDRS